MFRHLYWYGSITLLWWSGTIGASERDPSVSAIEGLPEPVTEEHFRELIESSPFIRSLDLSKSIILTGVARFDGRPVATLMDVKSRESYVISEVPNSQGWKLVEISESDDLKRVAAKISVAGGEVVTVRFDDWQLKPGEGKPATAMAPKTPRGVDRRPLPTDEDRRKFGEYVRKRMGKMSEEKRKQVGQIMQEKMKGNANMSDRQKGELFIQILDYVESGK